VRIRERSDTGCTCLRKVAVLIAFVSPLGPLSLSLSCYGKLFDEERWTRV
jgi:hypothetical protein